MSIELPQAPLGDYLRWYIDCLKKRQHNSSPGQVEIPRGEFDGLMETLEAIRDEKFPDDTIPE